MDDPSIEPTAPTVLLHTEEVRSRQHDDEEQQQQSSPTQLNETLQQQHEEASPPSPTLPAGAFTLKSPERVPVYSDNGQTPPPTCEYHHEQKNENVEEQPRRVSVSFADESNQENNKDKKVEEIHNENQQQQQQSNDPSCEIPSLNIVDDEPKPSSKKKTTKKSAKTVDVLPSHQEKEEDTLLRDLTKLGLQNYYKHFSELLLPKEMKKNQQQQEKGTDDANETVNDQKSQLSAPDPGDTPRAPSSTQQQQQNEGEAPNENQKHGNARRKVTCLAHLVEIPASHWEMYVPIKKHRDTIRAYLHAVNFSGTSWKSVDSKRINSTTNPAVNVRRQTAVSNVMQSLGHLDTLVDKKLGLQKSVNKVQSNFAKNHQHQRLDPRRSHNTLGVEGETEGMNADESTVVKSRIKKVVQELDEAKAKLQEAMGGLNQKNNINHGSKDSNTTKNESENKKKKSSMHDTSSVKKQKQGQNHNGNDDDDEDDDDEIIYKTPFPRQAFVCRPTSDKPRFGPFSRAAAAIQIQREEQNRIHNMIRKHEQEEKGKQRESFMQAMMNSLNENGGSFVLPDGSRVVRVSDFENQQGNNNNNTTNDDHEQKKDDSNNVENPASNETNINSSNLPSNENNVNPATPRPDESNIHDNKPILATATIPTTDLPFSPTPPTSTPTPKKLNQQRPQSATNNKNTPSANAAFASGHAFAYAKFSVFKADFERAERAPNISSASMGITEVNNTESASTPGATNQKNSRPSSATKNHPKMSSFQFKMVPGNSSTRKRQTRSPEKTTPRSENITNNNNNLRNDSNKKPSSAAATPIPLHHNYHSKPHPLQEHDLFLGSGNYPNCNDEIFAQTHPNYTFPRNTSSNLHISPEGRGAAGGSRSRSGSRSPSPNKNLGGHFHDPDVEALIIRSKEIELQKLKSKAASANPFYRKYFQQRQEKSSKKKNQEQDLQQQNNINGSTTSGNTAFSQYYFSTHAHQSKPASTKSVQHNYAASNQHQYPPRPMSAADAQSMPIPPASPRNNNNNNNNNNAPQFVSPPPPNIKTGYRSPSPAFWGCTTENDETLNTQRGFVLRGVGSARR